MKKSFALTLLMLVTLVLGACSAPQTNAPASAAATAGVPASTTGTGDFTKPHPILSDIRVRRAIATCTDRDALIGAVFPYVTEDLKPQLHMDSFLPKSHWAYKGPYMDYPHDVQKGIQLLEEAGWKLPEGAQPGDGSFRQNANGDTLTVKLTTTNAQFRQTWAAVVEQNLAECGVLLIRQHVPASWFFGNTTGL